MCPLSPTFIYNFLNVIIYLMLTWLNQTTSCHMFYQHQPLYADLAHPYIYCFLNVFCIYADLYHPDPSYVQIFTYITHCMPTLLTHTSIAFYMCYASMLTYITQTLHMFRFFTYITHCMAYNLCRLGSPIHLSLS